MRGVGEGKEEERERERETHTQESERKPKYLGPSEHVGDGDLLPEEASSVCLQVLEGLQWRRGNSWLFEVERRRYWYGTGTG